MANNCTSVGKYPKRDGRCCDQCPAGSHVKADCDGTKKTECADCSRGLYLATENYLKACQVCMDCSSKNNQRKVKDCTATENTVCECMPGFYCSEDHCEHCRRVSPCELGEGVKVRASRTNDTVCARCEKGTFSNVTDSHSPCQRHTRCEDLGRVLKTLGTDTSDAVCGDFKSNCHWILPAGLWSGLVLTALVVFGLMCWRGKRKSYKSYRPAPDSTAPVCLTVGPDSPLDLPLPSTESCTVVDCDSPLFNPDDITVSAVTQEDSCHPITQLQASVSFAETSHRNGGAANFFRTPSEPQEDEWCGT